MKKLFFPLPTHNSRKRHFLFLNKAYAFSFLIITACLCLFTMLLIPSPTLSVLSESVFFKSNTNFITPKFTIIIDPGHGGKDPGKVGTAGTLEKDINLQIALILKNLLESQDVNVLMTRDQDQDLAKTTSNFKASDMKERVALIQESNANLVISIHQNSYTDPDVYGAQCFYRTDSTEGKQLATILQNQIITSTNQTKIRPIKENNDYYLLKHSPLPTVIVECGFLSNPAEEQLLLTDTYQRNMAWAIHLGILQYFKNN